MRKLIAILFFCALPSFGTTYYMTQWTVQPSGADTNSGGFVPSVTSPGTDESQNNSGTAVTITLVTGTTGTSSPAITSTTHGPGNTVRITGGTGCTTGTYRILSQAAGVATFDATMGSATDACTGVLGGAKATIQGAIAVVAASLDTIWVQGGTSSQNSYTTTAGWCNAPSQASCGTNTLTQMTIEGYASTHGDITKPCSVSAALASPLYCPLLTTSTGSIELFNLYNNYSDSSVILQNLEVSNTASSNAYPIIAGIHGGPDLFLTNVKMDVTGTNSGGAVGIYNDGEFVSISIWGSECNVSSGNFCIDDYSESTGIGEINGVWSYYSWYHGAGTAFWDGDYSGYQTWHLFYNGFSGMSRAVWGQYTSDNSVTSLELIGNSFCSMTNEAVRYMSYIMHRLYAVNNIFWGGTYGMYINGYIANGSSVPYGVPLSMANAYGGQSTAAYVPYSFGAISAGVLGGTPAGMNSSDVTLTANPFNNCTSGDFSLTAAGKTALASKGFPGLTPFGTGYATIGALAPSGAGTSGGGGAYVQ